LTKAAEVEVIAGDVDLSTPLRKSDSPTRVTMTARQWTTHKDYDLTTRVNDIALIQLPVRISNSFDIASIFMHFQDLSIKSVLSDFATKSPKLELVGYLQYGKTSPSVLEYIKVDLTDAAKCTSSPFSEYMNDNQFCVKQLMHDVYQVAHYLLRCLKILIFLPDPILVAKSK
jgi:hypothetical protein